MLYSLRDGPNAATCFRNDSHCRHFENAGKSLTDDEVIIGDDESDEHVAN